MKESFNVRAWTNEQTGRYRFESYQLGDTLSNPVDLLVVVDAGDMHTALDVTWAIGNRMEVDANGKAWPKTVRSLSVGDVIAIQQSGGRQWFWWISRMGFEAMPVNDPCDCGKGDLCPQYGIRFAPAPPPPTPGTVVVS